MIRIAHNIDTFVFSGNHLVFRKMMFDSQAVEVIEMGGEDILDLIAALPLICDSGTTIAQLVSFFDHKYSGEQIEEMINDLVSMNLLEYSQDLDSRRYVEPFKLYEFDNNSFLVRIDYILYIIVAKSREKAEAIARKLFCRWGSVDDAYLIRKVVSDEYQCFPCNWIDFDEISSLIADIIDVKLTADVQEYRIASKNGQTSIENVNSFKCVYQALTECDGYWTEFITKVIDSNLIGNVQILESNIEQPFDLNGFVFLSTHILPNLEDGDCVLNDMQVGVGDTQSEACGKALMESLERYCCEQKSDDMFLSSSKALKGMPMVKAEQLACYLDAQLEGGQVKSFSEDEEYYWTSIFDTSGNSYYVPACHVWYCFNQSDFSSNKAFFAATTNGVAAHFSYEKAIVAAVQEVIERDVIMMWWLNRLSPPTVSRWKLDKKLNQVISTIEDSGYEVKVLDLTLDLLPVVMVVARKKSGEWPYFFCGAACNDNFVIACEKAIDELSFAIWNRSKSNHLQIEATDINYPLDHELFYHDPVNGCKLDFLFNGREASSICYDENHDSLEKIDKFLKKKGFDLFFKDITHSEIKKSGIEMFVVKVVIPKLVPITFGYFSEPLALQRIYSTTCLSEQRQSPLQEEEVILDYEPHFFA